MARIRTIKPEFFTSEDIVSLSPMARLLYISTWCEADKEGRLVWKPMTFKLRYFPGDNCDIHALCKELVDGGMVKLYGDGLAYIPQFGKHQHVNPRESASILPEPKTPRVGTRADASARVNSEIDPQVGREGKGKERKEDSVEPQSDSPPVVSIPLVDKTEFHVSEELLSEWKSSYPAVDVLQQLREMREWSLAKPERKKTPRGVRAFVVGWLGKEQDKGGVLPFRKPADAPAWAGAR